MWRSRSLPSSSFNNTLTDIPSRERGRACRRTSSQQHLDDLNAVKQELKKARETIICAHRMLARVESDIKQMLYTTSLRCKEGSQNSSWFPNLLKDSSRDM
jgi:hypothetical protein